MDKELQRYTERYNAENYDRLSLRVPKGKKAFIDERARAVGKSTNQYINDCINDEVRRSSSREVVNILIEMGCSKEEAIHHLRRRDVLLLTIEQFLGRYHAQDEIAMSERIRRSQFDRDRIADHLYAVTIQNQKMIMEFICHGDK